MKALAVPTSLALAAALMVAGVAHAGPSDYAYKTSTLHNVVISEYGKKPAPSGLLRTWLRIGVTENHLASLDVYLNYQGEAQKLPPLGATCDIVYHMGWIEGYFKPLQSAADRDRVIDDFTCKPDAKRAVKSSLRANAAFFKRNRITT
ncbi:MAG: hypothetical protein ACTHLA_08365 [Asticcacaulis sp.]|uniref:hypothetical protein n=1 Tax=Asticcacaulis sp. TaxID=1872648 RepID=UPI003F7C3680